jgi:hypothetical protein
MHTGKISIQRCGRNKAFGRKLTCIHKLFTERKIQMSQIRHITEGGKVEKNLNSDLHFESQLKVV